MTCIVAIKSRGAVYMGGDSCATHGTVPKILADGKVWRVGEFVMGASGSARISELVRHNFIPPAIGSKVRTAEQLDAYMNSIFVSALRALLSKNKCMSAAKGEDEYGEHYAGSLLVGVRGEIYTVDGSLAAYRVLHAFNSTGSGHEVALGALHALEVCGRKLSPVSKLGIALAAAERWQDGVRAPFTIVSVPKFEPPKPARPRSRGRASRKKV